MSEPLFCMAVVGAGSAAGEVMALILGAAIAVTIIWLGISRSRERTYTTTPTLPAPPLASRKSDGG